MNVFLQILIPALVSFIVLMSIMIARRYFKPGAIVACAILLILSVVFGGLSLGQGGAVAVSGEDVEYDQTGNNIIIAKQYLLDGQYSECETIINEMYRISSDAPDVIMTSARLALLKKDYATAALLYEKLGKQADSDEEYQGAALLCGAKSDDSALIKHFTSQNYDISQVSFVASDIDAEQVYAGTADLICDALKDEIEGGAENEQVLEAAGYASALTAMFAQQLGDPEGEYDTVGRETDRLGDLLNENEALRQNKYLRLAMLKGNILLRDYESVVQYTSTGCSLEENIVFSELLLNGEIESGDFDNEYFETTGEYYKAVLDQCENIVNVSLKNESKAVREEYEEKFSVIEAISDNLALYHLKQEISDGANEAQNNNLASKGYFQLAKIEYQLGNEEQVDENLVQAFGTLNACDDQNFVVPMRSIEGILENSDESDSVKKVNEFVSEAIDNSLPLSIEPQMLGQEEQAQTSGDGETSDDFQSHMADLVSEKTAVINIGTIDTDAFPNVRARVQINSALIDSPQDINQYLQVRDCNVSISDFSVSKLEYSKSRIILLCDVSGSMEDKTEDLKNAVISFAQQMNADEEIAVIGFNDSIQFESQFSDDQDVILSCADRIYPVGGTDMYTALLYAGGLFPSDINANNIVILMTDGQDNTPKTQNEIRSNIGALAASNDVTVYTLGLGADVDTAYLELIADAGNGSFLYVDNEASLNNFYDFIHHQITNQYILEYTAVNQTLNKRELSLKLSGEMGGASKVYYLVEPDYSQGDNIDPYEDPGVTGCTLTVDGFGTKFLYNSTVEKQIKLTGSGFSELYEISIAISDNVKYLLEATHVDANTYSVRIPSDIANGSYDLEVTINGESFTFDSELTVAPYGTTKTFNYGAYSFSALTSRKDDNGSTVLSGNVVMNDWLYFKGDVIVEGEYLNTGKIMIADTAGCYIPFSQGNSSGLASYLADKGVSLPLGTLGSFYIYQDEYEATEYESFTVDKIEVLSELNVFFMALENNGYSIYPDTVKLDILGAKYKLPFQKQLLRNFPDSDAFTYSGGLNFEGMVNSTKIGLVGEAEYKDYSKFDSKDGIKFSMASLPLKLSGFDFKFDTFKNDYSLEAGVKFAAFKDMDELEMNFEVKDGKFDAIGLRMDGDLSIPLVHTPVPITMSHFGLEFSGFSGYEQNDSLLTKILETTITAKFDINAGDVTEYLPFLDELIKENAALATLKDCELSVMLKELHLSFNADLVLLTLLDIGECEIDLGKFDYTNALIGYNNETEYGMRAAVTCDLVKFSAVNCDVNLSATGEIVLGYPYSGLMMNGTADFDIKWWILKADFDVSGDVLIGVYQNSKGEPQFSIVIKGTGNDGKESGVHMFVTPSTKFAVKTF